MKERNKNARRTLALLCSVSICQSLVSWQTVMPVMAAQETDPVTVDLYPVPQSIEYDSEEGMKFEGDVDVVLHGKQDEATAGKLDEILGEAGISYNIVDEASADHAAIVISSDPDHCDECAELDGTALTEEQGYILVSDNDANPKGQVTIVGADEDGAYYGLLSLGQMLDQADENGNFAEAEINDWPDIKLRGFVEGFYGNPWSFEGRSSLMHDASEFKMNVYIYAPKDDPYHKDQWRTLYPEEEAQEIKRLVDESKKENVSFCWSAHPGYGFNYDTDDDFNALINKLEQLYDLGVRQFGISYDDLEGSVDGTKHAQLINRVIDEFVKVKGDVLPIITVGTRYCQGWGVSMDGYFKPFVDTLYDDVVIMWTGKSTMSLIDKETYEWPRTTIGTEKEFASWWNYPVNDYCGEKMMMAPLTPLYNDVDNMTGFFLNPLSQSEASKVAIFSGADYSWNVGDFEAYSSWDRAIEELVPECADSFKRFADNISGHSAGTMVLEESRLVEDKIDAMTNAISTGENVTEAAQALKEEFETYVADCVAIRNMSNTHLLSDVEPWLEAYEHVAQAGVAAMDGFIKAGQSDILSVQKDLKVLNDSLEAAGNVTFETMTNQGNVTLKPTVCQIKILPLLNSCADAISTILNHNLSKPAQIKVISSDANAAGEASFEGITYSLKDASATLEKNGWIGLTYSAAGKTSSIRVESEQAASLKIQYSINGIDWEDADCVYEEGVVSASGAMDAAYVRVINTGEETISVSIPSMTAAVIFEKGDITVTTNMGTYQNYYLSNAYDGDLTTKYWSNDGSAVGDFVLFDFGKNIPLYDIKVYFGANPKGLDHGADAFKSSKVEISEDGITWTQVGDLFTFDDYQEETIGDIIYCTMNVNGNGQLGRYMKLTAMEAFENWTQIYEVEYNQTVSVFGDGFVNLTETNMSAENGNTAHLHDGDLNTWYEAKAIEDGDYIVYKTSVLTDVGSVMIVQDEDSICNAEISVLDAATGEYRVIGTLDEAVTRLNVDSVIKNVKLTFKADQPLPKIAEILFLDTVMEVDTSLAEKLIDVRETVDLDRYVSAGKDEYLAACDKLDAAVANKASQKIVDEAVNEWHSAWLNLRLKADESLLKELVGLLDEISGMDKTAMVEEEAATWTALEADIEAVLAKDEPEMKEANALINRAAVLKATDFGTVDKVDTPVVDKVDTPSISDSINTEETKTPVITESSIDQILSSGAEEAVKPAGNPEAIAPSAADEEAVAAKVQNVVTEATQKSASVKTGSLSMAGFYTAALAASLGALCSLGKRRK